ncbi:unnamed protein product [Acanthosepion pharaonis]|uniref:Uncharacterized protein n=1 Tax=Acanthosepion pharaonis TaxID=158019 RepID=A0A812B7E9_ACAPH|nr:unnamed protein product [Sepia pharaonis]
MMSNARDIFHITRCLFLPVHHLPHNHLSAKRLLPPSSLLSPLYPSSLVPLLSSLCPASLEPSLSVSLPGVTCTVVVRLSARRHLYRHCPSLCPASLVPLLSVSLPRRHLYRRCPSLFAGVTCTVVVRLSAGVTCTVVVRLSAGVHLVPSLSVSLPSVTCRRCRLSSASPYRRCPSLFPASVPRLFPACTVVVHLSCRCHVPSLSISLPGVLYRRLFPVSVVPVVPSLPGVSCTVVVHLSSPVSCTASSLFPVVVHLSSPASLVPSLSISLPRRHLYRRCPSLFPGVTCTVVVRLSARHHLYRRRPSLCSASLVLLLFLPIIISLPSLFQLNPSSFLILAYSVKYC